MYRGLYRRQKVFTLSDIAFQAFGNALIYSLESNTTSEGRDYEIVRQLRDYIESIIGTTSRINEQFLNVISRSDINLSVLVQCLQILLNNSVKSFRLGTSLCYMESWNIQRELRDEVVDEISFEIYDRKLWNALYKLSGGLQTLSLENSRLNNNSANFLIGVLRKCPNLAQLRLPYNCIGRTLNVIAKNCKNLRFLKLTGFYDSTEGVEYLCKNSFANVFTRIGCMDDCFDESVCWNVVRILQQCPTIEILLPFSYVGRALKICLREDENFRCNLKYLRDTKTIKEDMQVIIETCPHLKALTLIIPYSGVLQVLKYSSLQKLALNTFICAELLSLLEIIGHQLQFLAVSEANTGLDIADIARFCPSLTEIDFQVMDGLKVGRGDINFEHLEKITLWKSPLSEKDLKKLICSSNNLKILRIGKLTVNDQYLEDIFTTHAFQKLEEFCVFKASNLTVATVHMLLLTCPNLQKIGTFFNWNITQSDIDSIRCLEKCGRFDFVFNSSLKLCKPMTSMALTLHEYLSDYFHYLPPMY